MAKMTEAEWAVEKASRIAKSEAKICPISNTNCYASGCQFWGDYFAQCEILSIITRIQKYIRSVTVQEY